MHVVTRATPRATVDKDALQDGDRHALAKQRHRAGGRSEDQGDIYGQVDLHGRQAISSSLHRTTVSLQSPPTLILLKTATLGRCERK